MYIFEKFSYYMLPLWWIGHKSDLSFILWIIVIINNSSIAKIIGLGNLLITLHCSVSFLTFFFIIIDATLKTFIAKTEKRPLLFINSFKKEQKKF